MPHLQHFTGMIFDEMNSHNLLILSLDITSQVTEVKLIIKTKTKESHLIDIYILNLIVPLLVQHPAYPLMMSGCI